MVRLIPASKNRSTQSRGEIKLFEVFYNDRKHDDWVVIHSQDIMHFTEKWMGEIDYIIIIPNKGIVCMEVKACSSPYPHITDEGWIYKDGAKADPDGPFVQIKNNTQGLRRYIKSKIPESRDIIFSRMVLFTNSDFKKESSEWFNWEYYNYSHLNKSKESVFEYILNVINNFRKHCENKENFFWFNSQQTLTPNKNQIKQIVNAIRPNYEFFLSPEQRKLRLTNEVKQFTEDQFYFLDLVKNFDQIIVDSPAGTGKTFLAIEAARRAYNRQEKTLFICFNKLLGLKIGNLLDSLSPLVTFKRMMQLIIEISETNEETFKKDNDFWSEITNIAISKVENSKYKNYFDHIIIDEAQDILTSNNLIIFSEILKGGLEFGKLTIFGDFEWQSVHNFDDDHSNKFIDPLILKKDYCPNITPPFKTRINCRNTPRISAQAVFLGDIKPGYDKILRYDDGRNPTLSYYKNESEQIILLKNIIKKLKKENYQDDNITILSFVSNKNSLSNRIIQSKDKDLNLSLEKKDKSIFCTSIRKYKGLENIAIIITDIDDHKEEKSKALLYVGITRSFDRLFMLAKKIKLH